MILGQLTEQPTTPIRSVTLTRRIVVGTNGGEICEIEKDGQVRVVAQGSIEYISVRICKEFCIHF